MRMQLVAITVVSVVFSTATFAQVQATSPGQVKGNIEINAKQKNTLAVAAGEGNVAKNTAASIKGNNQIAGNIKLNANQKNSLAIAVGKNNKTANESAVIGGD